MAEGRQREAWNHTSHVLTMLYNIHRDPRRTKAASAADFHPLSRRQEPAATLEQLAALGVLPQQAAAK